MSIGPDDDTIPDGVLPKPPPGLQPWSGPCLGGLPCGKGVFVRDVDHGGAPGLFAERLEWLGVKFAMVQCIWQKPGRDIISDMSRYPAYAAQCRARGIELYAYGWSRPERKHQFVAAMTHGLHQLAGAGSVINAEAPWRGNHSRDAQQLLTMMRASHGDRLVGVTTYGGGPGMIHGFPFAAFSDADFVVPQLYDWHHEHDSGYPVRGTKRYLNAGYRYVVPALGASNAHGPEDMKQHLRETPTPIGAACWWDLYWILRSKARSQAIREMVVPGSGGNVA